MEECYWVHMVALSSLSPQLTGRWAEISNTRQAYLWSFSLSAFGISLMINRARAVWRSPRKVKWNVN